MIKMIELNYQIKEEIKMKFHDKLIKLRKNKGISQEELAEMMDVSRQAISRWELSSTLPDVPNLLKISEIFDVSADYLIRDDYEADNNTFVSQGIKTSESGNSKLHYLPLIFGAIFLIIAFVYLIVSIIEMDIIYVLISLLNCSTAVNFFLIFRYRNKNM